ncbi:general secretion pathway protein GspK [Thalassotalea euphylliae]|nr:type II secretion system protein GspK [Thalassotalea euphylliae]
MQLASLKATKGMALIQILILVGVLSTIALYISQSTRQQVTIAQWSIDRAQAYVNAHSAKNAVLFELLTNEWQTNKINSELIFDTSTEESSNVTAVENSTNDGRENREVLPWNLYSEPFKLTDSVEVRLQDQAGLLSLHFPLADLTKKRFMLTGASEEIAEAIGASLLDWQDSDSIARSTGDESAQYIRNALVQDTREILLLKNMSIERFEQVESDFTLFGASYINLMTSPETVLTALSNQLIAEEIVKLRLSPPSRTSAVRNMMGLSSDIDVYFTPNKVVKISISSTMNDVELNQTLMVKFSPYSTGNVKPFTIKQRSGS